MLKLNDNNIIVGQIKQILKDFNLPKCSVENSLDEYSKEDLNCHFIYKDDLYFRDAEGNPKKLEHYFFNKPYLNLTTNLKIENLLYDRYTHRYLGKYLRFIRDYKNVNLMSMYNCFDNETYPKSFVYDDTISLLLKQPDDWSTNYKNYYTYNKATYEYEPNTSSNWKSDTYYEKKKEVVLVEDDSHTIYSVPLRINEVYTISLSCELPIEMCVTIDSPLYQKGDAVIETATYVKTKISNIYLYDKLKTVSLNDSLKNILKTYPDDIRLLIKLPKAFDKGLTVLEGDFKTCSSDYNELTEYIVFKDSEGNIKDSGFYINPQLTSYLGKEKTYLVADRLIEYLTGNVISPLSESYDISKLQLKLLELNSKFDESDRMIESTKNSRYLGLWDDLDKAQIRYLINKNSDWTEGKELNHEFDLIGYCDKEIESKINEIFADKGGMI